MFTFKFQAYNFDLALIVSHSDLWERELKKFSQKKLGIFRVAISFQQQMHKA